MRICIPTVGKLGLKEQVSDHFGSAPFFTIVDTDTNAVEIVANANQHHEHGSCKPTAAIQGRNVDQVVCRGMGMRAVSLLNDAGVRAYKFSGETVEQALTALQKSALQELTPANACQLHNCH